MRNPELFAHTLSILDHPSDPMVVHLQIGFTEAFRARGFTHADFQAATLRLLTKNARLRSALRCETSGFEMHADSEARAAALNDRAWSENHRSLAEFRQLMIPFAEAPLFRFRLDPTAGFYVGFHHCLMDGFGCAEFMIALLGELHPPAAVPAAPSMTAPPAMPFLFRLARLWVLIRGHLQMTRELSRHPTWLFGPSRTPPEQGHGFLTRKFSTSELKRIRDARPAEAGRITLNDLILAAVHLAIDDFASADKKPGRLSLTVPVNRRPRAPETPPFSNGMGYVNISSLPEHRANGRTALERVRHEMAHAKRYQTEEMLSILMNLFERLGLLRLARRAWLKNRMPARYEGPEPFFWKNMDTALVTNLGALAVPAPYSEWISEVYGFAPVISPGVGLAILGFGDQLHLGLRFGTSVLTEAEGNRFLDAFVRRLKSLD